MKLDNLSQEQKNQVLMQWDKHQHERMNVNFELTPYGDVLEGFVIHPQVWNPMIVSARYHASYLFHNNGRLYVDKSTLDIGCGTGLMGTVMGLYGASHVTFSDISQPAVINTKENVKIFGLENKSEVIQGDLFKNINSTFDFISFMQPYFADTPPVEDTIAASMLNAGELIDRFLSEAPKYLNENGIIMMPSFDLAGDRNNPEIQGPKFGFDVSTTFKSISTTGVQKGEIRIHELVIKS